MSVADKHVSERRTAWLASGGLATALGLALCAAFVPRILAASRGIANALVVLGTVLVAGGWILIGMGVAGPAHRWRGAALGLVAYLAAGAVWTIGFVLVDPWQVDYSRVNLLQFVLYSVLLWPYAAAYTFDWFGLGGI